MSDDNDDDDNDLMCFFLFVIRSTYFSLTSQHTFEKPSLKLLALKGKLFQHYF